MARMTREEEEKFWEELENEGLVIIPVEILPECASYEHKIYNWHGKNWNVWKGISGKRYYMEA